MNTVRDRLAQLSRPTGQEDLLTVRYPSPRWQVSPRQALAAVGLIAVVVWIGVLRPGSEFSPVDATSWPSSSVAAAPSIGPPPAVSQPEDAPIVVSVLGEVEHAGLYTLAPGTRVAEVLAQARPRPEADILVFNHAQVLEDGQQLVVRLPGEQPGEPPDSGDENALPGSAAGRVNINRASATELEQLPGIGPATAQAIIAYRDETGGFGSVAELLSVSGIGPAKFSHLEDLVTVDAPGVR